MSKLGPDLLNTLEGVFPKLADLRLQEEVGYDSSDAWSELSKLGLHAVLVSEDKGGVDGDFDDAFEIIKATGTYGLSMPLGETIFANWLFEEEGCELDGDPVSLMADGFENSASLSNWVLYQDESGDLSLVEISQIGSEPHSNVASEKRLSDTPEFLSRRPLKLKLPPDFSASIGALIRSAQMAGAVARLVEMTAQYASERIQFGRSLNKFQAVQQNLAQLTSAAASIDAIARTAFFALNEKAFDEIISNWGDVSLLMAAAKYRASSQTDLVTRLAHQIHGAMGFTYEYELQFFTRRLWSWRAEYGGARFWSLKLGQQLSPLGGQGVWEKITALN